MNEYFVAGVIIAIVQVLIGAANAYVAKKAAELAKTERAESDLLFDLSVGKGSIKFDKTDILAVAFSVFIFWAVNDNKLDADEGVAAFAAVITGTGVKELVQTIFPATGTSSPPAN